MSKKHERDERKKQKLFAFLKISETNDKDGRGRNSTSTKQSISSIDIPLPTPVARNNHNEGKRQKAKGVKRKYVDLDSPAENQQKHSKIETSPNKLGRAVLSQEQLNELRAALRQRQNIKLQKPLFYLKEPGLQAELKPSSTFDDNGYVLLLEDIQQLLFSALVEGGYLVKPKWCELARRNKVSHTVVLVIRGIGASTWSARKSFHRMRKIFNHAVQICSPESYKSDVLSELLLTPTSQHQLQHLLKENKQCGTNDRCLTPLESLAKVFNIGGRQSSRNKKTTVSSKTDLLLGIHQMFLDNYPVPGFGEDPTFLCTKDEYKEPDSNSPLFAIDCEMCLSIKSEMVLTSIAVVDESLTCVYKTFVKPKDKIVDYITKYSGITPKKLQDVTTTLEDVQRRIREIIPPDGILCGQSLNGDLKAFKMFHPFVIDTSVCFNLSGIRMMKPSLKMLAQVFLGEVIQDNPEGHCALQDATATMKLVKLKLENGLEFGDAVCNPNAPTVRPVNEPKAATSDDTEERKLNSMVLTHLSRQKKNSLLVGPKSIAEHYVRFQGMFPLTKVELKTKSSWKKVLKHAGLTAMGYNLTLAQVDLPELNEENTQDVLDKLDSKVQELADRCAENALLIGIFCGLPNDRGLGLVGLTSKPVPPLPFGAEL